MFVSDFKREENSMCRFLVRSFVKVSLLRHAVSRWRTAQRSCLSWWRTPQCRLAQSQTWFSLDVSWNRLLYLKDVDCYWERFKLLVQFVLDRMKVQVGKPMKLIVISVRGLFRVATMASRPHHCGCRRGYGEHWLFSKRLAVYRASCEGLGFQRKLSVEIKTARRYVIERICG